MNWCFSCVDSIARFETTNSAAILITASNDNLLTNICQAQGWSMLIYCAILHRLRQIYLLTCSMHTDTQFLWRFTSVLCFHFPYFLISCAHPLQKDVGDPTLVSPLFGRGERGIFTCSHKRPRIGLVCYLLFGSFISAWFRSLIPLWICEGLDRSLLHLCNLTSIAYSELPSFPNCQACDIFGRYLHAGSR